MQTNINERYLDVDFRVEAATIGRLTGGLPRFEPPGTALRVYEEVHGEEMIDEDEWKDRIEVLASLEPLLQRIKDQNGEKSCTSNQQTQKWQVICFLQFGVFFELSAISLYKQVINRHDTGSTLPDNAAAMANVGALPADTPENIALFEKLGISIPTEHYFPHIGFRTRFPRDWEKTAKLFRDDEQFDVVSFEGLMSCLLRAYPVGYARDGHSVLAMRPMWDRQQGFIVKYANSWGVWGDDGYGYDSRKRLTYRGQLPYGGGTVTRTVITPPGLIRPDEAEDG